jgi:peroxin-16
MASDMAPDKTPRQGATTALLSLPPKWLRMYDGFISKNAGQVSQIESALRSLTYIIPGTDLHMFPSPSSEDLRSN